MCKVLRGTIVAAVGMALLSCTAPPMQENGAAISFGIAGFDIGAILGSVLAPAEAYVLPPPPSVIPHRTRKSYGDHSYARSKAPSAPHISRSSGGTKSREGVPSISPRLDPSRFCGKGDPLVARASG